MVPYLMQDQNDMELQLLVKPTLKFSKVETPRYIPVTEGTR